MGDVAAKLRKGKGEKGDVRAERVCHLLVLQKEKIC
jgi:hypothetical protein